MTENCAYARFLAGRTAVHITAENGQLQLFRNGVRVNYVYPSSPTEGCTPLQLTAEESSEYIAKLLLHTGAQSSSIYVYGATPLHTAAMNGHLEIAKHLLNHGANINAIYTGTHYRKGCSPLHFAVEQGDEEFTRLLLDRGADFYCTDESGVTALHIAAMKGYLQIAEYLVNHGADVNSATTGTSEKGWRPLHFAVSKNNEEFTKLLLGRGAHSYYTDEHGITPLHIAAMNGHLQIAEHLLNHRADINAACIGSLIKYRTPLHFAVRAGNEKFIRLLLDRSADVHCTDECGATALHIAADEGHLQIAQHLLNHGSDVNSASTDLYCKDYTPLHIAVEKCDEEFTRLLLDRSADVHCTDACGATPLHIATMNGHLQITEHLLNCGAFVNSASTGSCESVNTPLDIAVINENEDLVKLLLIYKVDVNGNQRCIFPSLDVMDQRGSAKGVQILLKCQQEIESLKRRKIGNSAVTFHDILRKSVNWLAMYAKNDNIIQIMNSDDYKMEFPLYASMINSRFKKGIDRRQFFEQGCEFLQSLFKNLHRLPENCFEKILCYLSDRDVKGVVDAIKYC